MRSISIRQRAGFAGALALFAFAMVLPACQKPGPVDPAGADPQVIANPLMTAACNPASPFPVDVGTVILDYARNGANDPSLDPARPDSVPINFVLSADANSPESGVHSSTVWVEHVDPALRVTARGGASGVFNTPLANDQPLPTGLVGDLDLSTDREMIALRVEAVGPLAPGRLYEFDVVLRFRFVGARLGGGQRDIVVSSPYRIGVRVQAQACGPEAPPPNATVGDILFSHFRDPADPNPALRSGILSYADRDGGDVTRAVASADFPGLAGMQRDPAVAPVAPKRVAYVSEDFTNPTSSVEGIFVSAFEDAVANDELQQPGELLAAGQFRRPAWSPDGKWIAATDYPNNRLALVHVESGAVSGLFEDPLFFKASPAWGPNRSTVPGEYVGTLYFIRSPDPSNNPSAAQPTLSSIELTIPAGATNSAQFLFDPADRQTLQSWADIDAPAVSPDGTRIAFSAKIPTAAGSNQRIYWVMANAPTEAPIRVTSDVNTSGYHEHRPVWWDDDTLVYAGREFDTVAEFNTRLYVVDRHIGSDPVLIERDGGPLPGSVAMPAIVPADLR